MKLIVALTKNTAAIGNNNNLVVECKADMKYFRNYTLGNSVVMGRKTWESLGGKPLKLRTNYVITSQKYCSEHPDVIFIKSLEEAPDDAIVIGGRQVYLEALKDPRLNEISMTVFHENILEPYEADTHLHEIMDIVHPYHDVLPNRFYPVDHIPLLPFNQADVYVYRRKES